MFIFGENLSVKVKTSSIIVLCLFITSCSSTTKLQRNSQSNSNPIFVENSESVSFHKVIFRVDRGKEVGKHHDGLARVPQSTYTWGSGISIGSDDFKIHANEELINYGYSVPSGGDLLFSSDRTGKARYQIGAEIEDITFNTYAPLAGDFGEASVEVQWQIYDSFASKVVYKSHNSGYARSSNDSGVIIDAFLNSLNKIMSKNEFASLLQKDTQSSGDGASQYNKLTINNNETTTHALPENVDQVNKAVVTIESGFTHGSGFFVDSNGHLLTAAHVVSGLDNVQVRTNQGFTLPAKVLRINENSDVALLKVDGSGFSHIEVNDKKQGQGTDTFAIGTPLDKSLSNSISKGIISSYRTVGGVPFLQTDTSLNPGNSGGPLLNSNGEAIGIVSWKYSQGEGVAFCVGIEHASDVLNINYK